MTWAVTWAVTPLPSRTQAFCLPQAGTSRAVTGTQGRKSTSTIGFQPHPVRSPPFTHARSATRPSQRHCRYRTRCQRPSPRRGAVPDGNRLAEVIAARPEPAACRHHGGRPIATHRCRAASHHEPSRTRCTPRPWRTSRRPACTQRPHPRDRRHATRRGDRTSHEAWGAPRVHADHAPRSFPRPHHAMDAMVAPPSSSTTNPTSARSGFRAGRGTTFSGADDASSGWSGRPHAAHGASVTTSVGSVRDVAEPYITIERATLPTGALAERRTCSTTGTTRRHHRAWPPQSVEEERHAA